MKQRIVHVYSEPPNEDPTQFRFFLLNVMLKKEFVEYVHFYFLCPSDSLNLVEVICFSEIIAALQ